MTVEPEVLDALRICVDGLHPSSALKDAVMRDLPDREARRPGVSPRTAGLVRLLAGLAAAAALVVAVGARLRGPEPASRPAPPVPVAGDDAAVTAARARNVALYARERARLHRDLPGKWVVLADRDPATVEGAFKPLVVGETLEAVAGLAADAPHRFVFRVGEDGDEDVFVSAWYAPRFAGHGLVTALGLQLMTFEGLVVSKGARTARFGGATPFPRVAFHLAAPDGTPSPRNGDATPEVFVGSVGPDLMLTPQDAAELRLARWEVPGTATVGGVPCRRVRVTASVPAVGATGSVIACVPDVPYADLVDQSRARHAFWEWDDGLRDVLALDRDPVGSPLVDASTSDRWVVFGNDRVLGRGTTAEAALDAADAFRDVVYHRYVTPWPRPVAGTTLTSVESRGGEPAELSVGALVLQGDVPSKTYYERLVFDRWASGPATTHVVFVVRAGMDATAWASSRLALGELPTTIRVAGTPTSVTTRAALVRGRLTRSSAPGAPVDVLALVVAATAPPPAGTPR